MKIQQQSLKEISLAQQALEGLDTYSLVGNITPYQSAIKGLSTEQAVLALSTKGLNAAQIEEVMTTETATLAKESYTQADVQAALAKNELATASTVLTTEQQSEIINSGLLTSEKLAEIAATLGLETAENGNLVTKKVLNAEMVKQQLEGMGIVGVTQKQILAMLGLAEAEKKASLGMKALMTAGGMIAMWVIISGVELLVKRLDKLINSEKYAEERLKKLKEEGEQAAKAIDDLNEKLKSDTETVRKAGAEYAKFASSVHNVGKSSQSRGMLSTEEYEKFLEVSNELAKVFPELTTGYDDNGNALLNLGDDVETITSKLQDMLEVQKEIANQEFMENMPKVYDGFKASTKQNKDNIQVKKDELELYGNLAKLVNNGGTLEYIKNNKFGKEGRQELEYWSAVAKQIGLSKKERQKFIKNSTYKSVVDFSILDEGQLLKLERIINNDSIKAQSNLDILIKENELENARMAFYYKEWAKKDSVISTLLNENQTNSLMDIFDTVDWSKMPDKFEDAIRKIQMEIIPLVQDNPDVANAFNNLLDPEHTLEEYKTALKLIQDYYSSQELEIPAYLKLDYTGTNGETADEYIQDIINKTTYELPSGDKIFSDKGIDIIKRAQNELSLEDLEIAANVVSLGDTWDDVLEKIKQYKEEVKNASSTTIEPFKDITEAVDLIKKDLSSAFKELGSAYTDIFEIDSDTAEIKFSLDNVDNEMLSGIRDAFDDLEDFDIEHLNDFFEVLSNGESTADDVQKAFDRLAGSYLYSSEVMDKLNDETAESIVKQLEAMGIANAETLVNDALALKLEWVKKAKENGIKTSNELQNATYEEISALKDENDKLDETEQKLVAYWTQKNIGNNITIMTNGDVQNLVNLMTASDKTCEKLKILAKIKAKLANLDDMYAKGEISASVYEAAVDTNTKLINGEDIKDDVTGEVSNIRDILEGAQKEVETYYAEFGVNTQFNGGNDYQKKLSDAQEKAAENSEKSKETFDWVEKKIASVERIIDKLNNTIDNTYTNWSKRNKAIADEIGMLQQEYGLEQQAYNTYMGYANSLGLDQEYVNLIQNGQMKIETITDEDKKELINEYQTWYDKANEALVKQREIDNQINQMIEKRLENIKSIYEYTISTIEHSRNMIQNKLDVLDAQGLFANGKYYQQLIAEYRSEYGQLQKERAELVGQMNQLSWDKDSEAYHNVLKSISEIDEKMVGLNVNIIETNNSLRNLGWEVFEYLEESLTNITSEAEYLVDLLSKEDLFNKDNGNFTKYADATISLRAVNYDIYKQQAKDYEEELTSLQSQLHAGAGKEVLEQYNKMVQAHRDAVKSANEEKEAILQLIEDGYNAQLEAIQKVIDKKKEQMNQEKSLYDYQKSIAEKTKNIASLEKQKMAYEGDDSEEGISKIQKIKVELEEAKADLKETEYEKYLSDTENMLDELHD